MTPLSKPQTATHPSTGASIGPLPYSLTTLIGRDDLLRVAIERLSLPTTRLLTFVGPGGIGKSRLALEVAHAVSDRYRDGALLIRLAAVTDPSLVRASIARALGINNPDGDRLAWTMARERQVLLLVDNFEQVLPAASDVIEVLTNCRNVTVLVTSRVPLHVTGEHEFQVPPLVTPTSRDDIDSSDAVRLFAERATSVNANFALTSDNSDAVAEITRQLDGLPLAIELAAAQSKHLTPAAIVDRLRDAAGVLRGGPIDLPPHQRAIRETIAWSYDLLDEAEQARFRRLSVFASGFLPQAAAYICQTHDGPPQVTRPQEMPEHPGDILESCISLADKSLIFRTADHYGEPRFAMLLTIRNFAHGELHAHGEWEEVHARQAECFLAFAERAELEIESDQQRIWLAWVDREHPNLRAALEWFRESGDWNSYARIANAVSNYWMIYGHHAEGLRWLRAAIDSGNPAQIGTFLYVDLLCSAGWLAYRLGRADEARELAERGLETARATNEVIQVAETLNLIGYLEDRSTNYPRAEKILRESLTAYREAGHKVGVNETLISLGGIETDLGEYRQAEQTLREALESSDPQTDARTHARALDLLGVVFHTEGRAAESIEYAERANELYRLHGDLRGTVVSLDHIGKCARALGDLHRAWACHLEALPLRREVGDPRGYAVWMESVSSLLVSCGAHEAAAELLAAIDTVRADGAFPRHVHEQVEVTWAENQIRERVVPELIVDLRARGSKMALTEAVDFALRHAERAVADSKPIDPNQLDQYGLTARELEVLDGLERRLTDREIGDELSISFRTVSTHVASILSKLNLKSRRDVPALRDSR